jgi:WD40 repeat protein
MFSFKNKDSSVLQDKAESPINYIAFHPSGYYLAAAFVDRINFFYVANNSLKPYRHIMIKGCFLIRFSRGGHLLAAAHPKPKSTQSLINIYNAYTRQLVILLPGHTFIIRDLQWTANDYLLYSCALDGTISEWAIGNGGCRSWTS